jgi:hypothetical protein
MTDFVNYAYGNASAGTFTPAQLFADAADVRTQTGTVLSGQNLVAGQVVALDADGKIVTHLPSDVADLDASGDTVNVPTVKAKAVGIMALDVDATSADKAGTYYIAGAFNIAALTFHADSNTTAKKQAVFAGTPISVHAVID